MIGLVLGPSTGGIAVHVAGIAAAGRTRGDEVRLIGPSGTADRSDLGGEAWGHPLLAPVVLARRLAGCDIVHAHGARAGLLTALALRLLRHRPARTRPVPFLVTWHNPPRGPRGCHRVLARAADVSLCVSRDLCSRVEAAGGRPVLAPVAAGRRPAADDARARIRQELGLVDQPLVLAVARLAPQKGLDLLVRAATMIPVQQESWPPTVALAGEGPLRAQLSAQAARCGVDLRLLGARSDIGDLLAAADVVVLPSRWEGSPLVAQEALHAQRPLVATDVGGVRALVGDGAALVPPEDATALAAAIGHLLSDPAAAARLAAGGRQRAAGWPSAETSLAGVLACYDGLVAVRARRARA